MRLIILALLIVLLIRLIIVPFFRGSRPSLVLVIIAVSITGWIGWGEYQWQTNQTIGSDVVKMVSGNTEGILRCQTLSGAFFDPAVSTKGFVSSAEENVARVKYDTCQDLFSWMKSDKQAASLKQIQAIGVLTHEAVHVSGEYNEAVTECISMSKLEKVAEELRANKKLSAEISATYREEIHVRTPPQYQNGVC